MANESSNINKTSSWFKNVAKSLGYTGYDVLKEKMPFVMSTFEDNKTLISDTKQLLRTTKGSSTRLANILGQTAAKNIDSLKDIKKNALEDLKSGKFYNKSRKDSASLDFGADDDIFGDMDFGGDDDVSVDFEEAEDKDSRPNIVVNANINEDNPMVTAIKGQSDLIVETAKVTSRQNAIIADVQLKSMSNFVKQLHGGLTTINENVSQIVDFNSNHMSSYIGASLKFYDSQISLMGEVITELKKMTNANTKKNVDRYNSPIDDVMGVYGGFSVTDYVKLVKKQLSSALDSTMFGGTLKTMFNTDDAFLELINNPLSFVPKVVITKMIPDMTSKLMESFNKSFENFIPLFFDRIFQWGEKGDDPLGIKSFIGRTLGISTTTYTSIDPSKYEKGAVPFDGVTKKAITSVIPTYLRKILAHLTGNDELVFNSESGKWKTLSTVKKDYDKELNRVATREYSDIYDLESRVSKLNLDYKEQDKFNESIKNFFAGLSKSNIGFNPNAEAGSDKDLISSLFKDNDGFTDNEMAEMFRKMIKSLPKSTQMKIAREQLSGRVAVRNWINEKEANPDTLTDIISSGVLDDSLYKTKEEIRQEAEAKRNNTRTKQDARSMLDYSSYTQEQLNELFKDIDSDTTNRERTGVRGFFDKKFSKITDAVNKVLITGDNALYRIIFGKEGDKDKGTEGSFIGALIAGIKKPFSKFFSWFKDGFSKISEKLIGENGLLTKLEQSEFMKKIKSGFGKARNYLFGSVDADGKYKNGLFSDVGNELKGMKDKVKDYIMGPDNKDSVLNHIKNMFGSFKKSIKEYLFGEDGTGGAKEKAKGVLTDFGSALKDGFQSFANLFFGTADKLKNGKLQNKINVDELTAKLKENAPKTIASGIVGGSLGLIAGAGGFGVLGSLFLGPMSGVVLGIGTSILSRSEKFKNMLFGERDENGERTGGFISKSVQNFFKDNKKYLLGGAALGTVHGLLGGLGILPSLVAGGPITGAIFGLGAALLRKSETFQSFMFGDLDDDGKRRGGLITKLTNTVTSDKAMKKLGHAGAGAILGGIGGMTLSSFGMLGALSLGPLGGAIVGAGAGIALAADKWKEAIFGKFDENGNRTEAGLLSKLAVATSVNVLQPLKYKTMEWRFGVENWFEEKIALPIMESIEPIKEEFRRLGDKILGVFDNLGNALHIPDLLKGMKNNIFVPLTNTIKKVANTAITGIGKLTGWVLQSPVKLVSMVVDKIIVPKHMREGLRDARKMILKNIADSKPGQVITKTVSTVGNFTKGVISGVGDFAKSVIKGTFKVLGKTLLTVVKAPFQAIAAPIKAIGKISEFTKYRNRNYGSQEALHDIRSGNRGFVGSIGDLIQTFNPFSNIRASAKYQGMDMDALRERAIKEKFTDKDGNVIPYSEQELNKEVAKLARKYHGGASYQEDRINKANEYRSKIKDRREKRKNILDQYKSKIEENQNFAANLGYNLLSDEDKENVSFKELNKIEDSVYKKIYGKEYRNKSKFEQDNFKNQKAAQQATVAIAGDVKEIRNALLSSGAKVDVVNGLPGTSGGDVNNPITDSMGSSSDSMLALPEPKKEEKKGPSTALDRLMARSESNEYYKNFLTDGTTWAEQKQEQEAEDKEKKRTNIFQKILGSLEHGNDTRDKSAFDWGKIFSKTGLITAGLIAALPFILKFFKDPIGSLSGLAGSIVTGIKEAMGLTDEDGDRTNASGDTQTNDDMNEAMARGAGKATSVVLEKSSHALGTAAKAGKTVLNSGRKAYNTYKATQAEKAAGKATKTGSEFLDNVFGTKTANNVAENMGQAALTDGNANTKKKAISEFMNKLKSLPEKFAGFIKTKFPKKATEGALGKIINMIKNCASKVTVKVLEANYSKIGRALAYVVPGLNIASAVIDVGFVAYGLISGGTASETANLFHVNQKDVTSGMKLVSSALKGIANFSWCFIFTIVCDLVQSMTGFDLLHEIAVYIYKNLLPNTDDEKLDQAIQSFTGEYDEYTLNEQIRKGNVIYDEEGNIMYNEDGTLALKEGAEVETFDSFNDRTNKTLWAKMKEKITGKTNNLTDEEKQEQTARVDEAYRNGSIDRQTYEEMITDINGKGSLLDRMKSGGSNLLHKAGNGLFNLARNVFGQEENTEGIEDRKKQLSELERKFKNGEISGTEYNEQVDKLKEEIDKFAGKEGAINKITSKIGDMAKNLNEAGNKFLNEPLTDENGNQIVDEFTGKPLMRNELANFIKHGLTAVPGIASRTVAKIEEGANNWWNGQATDEEGNPLTDPITGKPVYNNKLHDFLSNGLTNLTIKLGKFTLDMKDKVKDWWDSKFGEDGKYSVSNVKSAVGNAISSLSSKIGSFTSKISESVKSWWKTEIEDPEDKGKKFKISDIGKYTSKIFTSLTSKISDFFSGLWNGTNNDGSTNNRAYLETGTTTNVNLSDSSWGTYNGGVGGPTSSTDIPSSSGNTSTSSNTKSSADYSAMVKQLYALYGSKTTSNYGWRTLSGKRGWHNGIDLSKAVNSEVPAFTAGTVTKTTTDAPANSGGLSSYYKGKGGSYGNHVVIRDDKGNYNYYAHLNKVNVQPGQRVSVGQPVGLLGHTGHSSAAHLHYEVRNSSNKYGQGYSYNPLNYLFGTYSTSDVGNNYDYSGSDGSSGTTTTTIPAPDYLGLTTLSNTISESLTTALEPFSKITESMNTLLGNYYGTNSPTTVTTSSGDSSGFGSSSGNGGSAEENAKRVYTALKAYGIPDINIAGVLGNWTHESGIDPTGIETISDEKYTLGPKKQAAASDFNAFTLNTVFPAYRTPINKKAYIGANNQYYPGIGLGQFTGPAASNLIKFAKEKGMNWYDLDAQLQFGSVPTSQGGYRNFMSGWKNPESSPSNAARVFLQKWEGISPSVSWVKLGSRQKVAEEYYKKFRSWNNIDTTKGVGGPEDEYDVPNDALVDGNGDGHTPVVYQLDSNFKNLLNKFTNIKKSLENNKNYIVDKQFKTMTYVPPESKYELQPGVGGPEGDEGVTLPDKIYEILNNMVTYLSNIATNTAETSTNVKNIKTTKVEAKVSKSSDSVANETGTNSKMLDIANQQKNAKSNDAYKNARLIASGLH